MAVVIDTNDPAYQTAITRLVQLDNLLEPRFRMLNKLNKLDSRTGTTFPDPTSRVRRWLERDPLMRQWVRMIRKYHENIGVDFEGIQ